MLGSILRQRELLRAIVSLHSKVKAALRLRGEKETKGVWKSPRFGFIRLTILAKIMNAGHSGHIGKLLMAGAPFNHRIDVDARICSI